MGFQINYGGFAFAVPGDVVDHYIRLADGDKLKVLLFVLRHASEQVTADAAAEYLHMDKSQAEEALQFWEQANVLRTGGMQNAGAFAFAVPVQEAAAEKPAPVTDSPIGTQRSSKEVKLDPSEIAAELARSTDLNELFTLAEKTVGHTLTHMEQRSLLWMNQYLNIPGEILIMLLNYCVSIEKYSISYAEAIAVRWMEQGIMTLENAEAEIRRMTAEHTFTSEIRKLFELKRSPTTKQKSYIDLWQKAGYPMELIKYAYEISVENIEKADFKYINTILQSWAENGVKDLAGAQKLRETPRSSGKSPKPATPASQEELDKMNKYLSLVNRFKEDDPNE